MIQTYYVETGDKISRGNNTKVQVNKVGYPANSFYVYQQVYDENGKPIESEFVDRNGDGIINSSDKYIYQKPAADFLMGLTSKNDLESMGLQLLTSQQSEQLCLL